MGWTQLPYDLVERVLANLSLHELALVSATSSGFRAVCYRRLAQEHKSRVDLAAGCFGRQQLIYLALTIDRFLKGVPLDRDSAGTEKHARWVLVEERPVRRH
jgi:hypothetical protein